MKYAYIDILSMALAILFKHSMVEDGIRKKYKALEDDLFEQSV